MGLHPLEQIKRKNDKPGSLQVNVKETRPEAAAEIIRKMLVLQAGMEWKE